MIVTFGNRATSDFYHGISSSRSRKIPVRIKDVALYKLDVLNAVPSLEDLKSPPGNRLEALKGDFAGFHSIRINEIVRGKRGVSPNTAWLLAGAFNTSPEFWLNLQATHDLSLHKPKHHVQPILKASA